MKTKFRNPKVGSVVRIMFHDSQVVGIVTTVYDEHDDDFAYIDLDLSYEQSTPEHNNGAKWELLTPKDTLARLVFSNLAGDVIIG